MGLKLSNTLTGTIDDFSSQKPHAVSLYTCGPTVYDRPHVGNWAAYIYWDTLVRVLTANSYEVNRVMNITDVGHLTSDSDEGEDKLEKGAKREGKSAWEIASYYTDDFLTGMQKLGLLMPRHVVKATDYIPQQLDLIQKLKEKGYTYQINDGIYFDTSKFPTYANFAHLNIEAMKAGARVEFNPEKRNVSDFALWKFTPSNQKRDMEWETPTNLLDGEQAKMGFPGWHVECSAIAINLLGNTLDIHTGGIDHITVHHTNEIAQSEAATGVQFSNYWLHNNHMKVNGTKISKSLGNGYTLDDLSAKGFAPLDFRMFVLQGHYKSEGNFTFEALQAAKNRLHNWRNVAALRHQIYDTLKNEYKNIAEDSTVPPPAISHMILDELNNDLSTPEALKVIDEAFTLVTRSKLSQINRQALTQLLETIDNLLGLQLIDSTIDIDDETKQIIIERNAARDHQDWVRADELRQHLAKKGIELRDTSEGSIWEYKS